jgi:RNA polymerase sigma-70 factor (ECF subfamily)
MTSATRALDPESAAWLRSLRAEGPGRVAAIARLHAALLRIAHEETQRRAPRRRIAGPELDDLAHQAAADALLAIVGKLDRFRGESRFTTWAHRFVVLEVASKLGRHFWREETVSLDDEAWERLPAASDIDPARQSESHELLAALGDAVEQQLTERQQQIFVARALRGVSLDVLAIEVGGNRNAISKVLFDARRKVRAALVADGHLSLPFS